MFPQELIKAKIEEAEKLVRLLDGHSIACELAAKPSVARAARSVRMGNPLS